MVTQMTNRLLATVLTVAVGGALTAHAAQDVHLTPSVFTLVPRLMGRAIPAAALSSATHPVTPNPTPEALSAQAASIRQAFQRDHDAIEHLRQQGSQLKGAAHIQLSEQIASDEARLLDLEKTTLATLSAGHLVDLKATIAQMDAILGQARTTVDQLQHEADAAKNSGD